MTTKSLTLPPVEIPEFSPELYIDLAIGTASFDDVCWANGYDPAVVQPWTQYPQFENNLQIAKRAVEDDGRAFQARCRRVVQDNVMEMEGIIQNREVTANHRIDAFKTLAKLGKLEPQESNGVAGGAALSLTIIAPGGQEVVINQSDAEPEPLEGEAITVSEEAPERPAQGVVADDLFWIEAPDTETADQHPSG